MEPRIVTLEYLIDQTGESQKLDFVQTEMEGDWICVLEEDEMNRILIAAYTDGKLDNETDPEDE